MRGKKAAPMLPEKWPNLLAIGLRDFQAQQSFGGKKFKSSFAVRWRQLLQFPLQLEQKHQPMVAALVTVLADDAGQVQFRR